MDIGRSADRGATNILLGLFCWLVVGSGTVTDADVIKAVLTWPLDSARLSDELRDPTTEFRKIAPKATLKQSVTRVYRTQVQISPDRRFAIVHLAVETTVPFCVLALVDVGDRKVLWLGLSGEFPAGLVPGVHVNDLMDRQTLLFCGGPRLLRLHFGGTVSQVDDVRALKSARLEEVQKVIDWDKEADKDGVVHVGDIAIRFARDTQWDVSRAGKRVRITEGGFVE